MKHFSRSTLAHTVIAAVFAVMPLQQSLAAPGTLPSAPLFLSTIVEPNIFFTLDDSLSMTWESIIDSDLGGITVDSSINYVGNPEINGIVRFYLNPDWYTDSSVIPPATLYPEAWILKNSIGNKLYYNPDITYQPWAGSDASGIPLYTNAIPTAALADPNTPGGSAVNLTRTDIAYNDGTKSGTIFLPSYYEWVDTDGDGIIHATNDSGTLIEIKPAITTYPSGRNYAEEIQNFANWFVYYRSRKNTLKAAIGGVINNSDSTRMGLSLFNAGHQVDTVTMSIPSNKLNLLKTFYASGSGVYTPARRAMEAVGAMFANETTTPPLTPILGAGKGGECQQNFNIFLTDGYWNQDPPTWDTKKPDSFNTDYDGSGIANNGFDGDANESVDNGNYADNYSNTLADVAMHFYESDLSSLPDEVPTRVGTDEASHQHLVTYAISFGVTGSLDPLTQKPTDDGFAWTDPFANNKNKIDDLWHAAYNGRGRYLFAQNSSELESSLALSISDISQRTGTAAAVAVNSAQLSTESVVYLAQFNTNRWQGNLFAYPIINQNTGELAATAKWDASSKLTLRDLTGKPRNIITYNDDLIGVKGVPFEWSKLSAGMQLDLKTNPAGGVDSDTVATARLSYLRGDRSNEGAGYGFRERVSLLGDLVNSGPVFVGEPNLAWPDYAPFPVGTEAYSEFKIGSAKTRQKMVYVGSNDGMLHALDDDTGEEVFAYIPGIVSSNAINKGLHYLADPNYLHNYYVDQTPTLSDVYITSGGSVEWHSVLVGGLRGGGRGVFALDVTNPAAFQEAKAADMVLWEFDNSDDADLGYTYSRPFIGLTNSGRWVAIFGNGYNDTGSGTATLFIVDIEKGADGVWSTGDYQKISTGVGDPTDRNGLSTPALADVDRNGTIDRVYAGDLKGNMWAFDLSDTNPANWGVAYDTGGGAKLPLPLFTNQTGQPITSKPVLASHPTQPDSNSPSNAPNIMVYFGSGQYLVNSDKTSTTTQSFYGVWDTDAAGLLPADLVEQTFDPSFTDRVLTRKPLDYSIDYGWYFNLTDSGERVVTSPIARADTVFFNTFVPENDPCSSGGYGYKFAVDMTTGGSPLKPTIDTNNDGVIDENDYRYAGSAQGTVAAVRQDGYLPEPVFIEDLAFTAETATKIKALKKVPAGRFSWQELIQ